MSNENDKKGFFKRLTGVKKPKKSSCCCNFEIEELPEDKNEGESPEDKKDNSCCR